MKKLNRNELLSELNDIHIKGTKFFNDVPDALKGEIFELPCDRPYERDEFWGKLPESLQSIADSLISRVIKNVPLIAESARMTSYLTQTDQIDLGHAIKGMRSALHLCRYRYWDSDILHDEGTVLGVRSAGQSDDEGIFPDKARQIFEDCYQRISGIVELVNPLTVELAELNIEKRGQLLSGFQPGTAFIMMWMDSRKPELEDVYNTIKRCFEKFGITSERADDIEHDGLITEEIIEKIKSSEFLYADLTGARPSVYYEVGFAHAISKRVILYRKAGERIHFDLAAYNCPEYTNLSDLEEKLIKRLVYMTGIKTTGQAPEK